MVQQKRFNLTPKAILHNNAQDNNFYFNVETTATVGGTRARIDYGHMTFYGPLRRTKKLAERACCRRFLFNLKYMYPYYEQEEDGRYTYYPYSSEVWEEEDEEE